MATALGYSSEVLLLFASAIFYVLGALMAGRGLVRHLLNVPGKTVTLLVATNGCLMMFLAIVLMQYAIFRTIT